MPSRILRKDALEQLLLINWTHLLDASALMRRVLLDTRNAELKVVKKDDDQKLLRHTMVTITKFILCRKGLFEIWVDFSIPVDDGTAMGVHSYSIDSSGELRLIESHGVIVSR